jgi:hypothetical protein
MAGRIANGWNLAKQSCAVLAADKKLLIFPAISSIACLIVLASFLLPIAFAIDWEAVKNSNGPQVTAKLTPAYYALLFAMYLVNYFVIIFFNSALVACVNEHFRGGTPSVSFGFSAALNRLPQIFMWALVSATVGIILQMIAERSKLVGAIIARLLGAAWTIATYFAVPILVIEKAGPVDVFKRSVELLKKTWGESIVGNVGIGLFVFLAFLVATIPAIAGIVLCAPSHSPMPAIVGGAITVVLWIIVGLVSSTLRVILTTAIYQYASNGAAPSGFDGEALQGAFRPKKKQPA